MNRFIKDTVSFLIFFGCFFVLLNAVFLALIALTDYDFRKRIEFIQFKNPDYDLIVLGSSLAAYGVDTEYLTSKGQRSYNLAQEGSNIKTNFIQLEEYIKKHTNIPDCVWLVVNSNLENFNSTGIQPVIEFTMKGHKYGIQDIPINKFRWVGVDLLKKFFSSKHRKAKIRYGQIKFEKATPDKTEYVDNNLEIEKFLDSYWIGEIVKLCKKNNIEIIIIDIPCFKNTQNKSAIGPYNLSFRNGYSAPLLNLNSQEYCRFIDPNEDWIGNSHFNEIGAEKFTENLLSTVEGLDLSIRDEEN